MDNKIITLNGKKYKLIEDEEQAQETSIKVRTGWERVDIGDKCFHLDSCLNPNVLYDRRSISFDKIYYSGNYINDSKLCEHIGRAISIYLRMLRWQSINDIAIDTSDPKTEKWYILYDTTNEDFCVTYADLYLNPFTVHFSSREKAQQCITIFREDLIWLHTRFFHRLDNPRITKKVDELIKKICEGEN